MIIPVIGTLDTVELPRTFRFEVESSIIVGQKLNSVEVHTSIISVDGSGMILIFDVISEILDGAR